VFYDLLFVNDNHSLLFIRITNVHVIKVRCCSLEHRDGWISDLVIYVLSGFYYLARFGSRCICCCRSYLRVLINTGIVNIINGISGFNLSFCFDTVYRNVH